MPEVQEVEDFDAEIFLVSVPEGLECKEELWVVRLTDLVVLGTMIYLVIEVLIEQFCNEIEEFSTEGIR